MHIFCRLEKGLPGFRRKNIALQALEIVRIGKLLAAYAIHYCTFCISTFISHILIDHIFLI